MNFAELIRAARIDKKLSQKALADQVSTSAKPKGIWATYIGQIEKGQKVPSDDVCIELARILGLERDAVLLAASRDRSDNEEARALFDRLLNERRLELDAREIRLLRECEPWMHSLAQIRRKYKGREDDITTLLSDLASLDKKQWEAAKIIFARFKEPFEEEG